ncbi:reverse transcriptase domain-containing protein [Tanacetum coccineum]
MKKLVQALPTLTTPRVGKTLTMHLTASKESISAMLATKINEGWTSIYFVSRVLQGAELNYPSLEKLVLALVHAARRLQRYFQAHTIIVLTNTPIKQILTGPEKIGRVAKWAIELGEHDIVFLKREEIEMPADFLVEIPSEDNEKKEKPKEVPDSRSKWRLYIHGASNSNGPGAGLMLIDPEGKQYTYALRFEFKTMNNKAEYEALLIKGTFAAKHASIKDYLQKVKTALRGFEDYTVEHVRRNQNKKADALNKLASMTFEHLIKEVLVKVVTKRFNEEPRSLVVRIMKQGFYWPSMHMEVAKSIQDYKKCKEESTIRKAKTSGAIAAGSTTLPRNNEKETPFSLTYGSEAVIPLIETTDDRGRPHKATKGKKSKEVALIELEYYRNQLQKYHNARSSHPTYIVGDCILLKRNVNEWQGLYIINEVHKEELYIIVDAANQSLVQIVKGTSLHKFYM